METIRLVRLETGPQGTFGVLYAKEKAFKSGELPWQENQAKVSCIPAGVYKGEWSRSPSFHRKLYQVFPVKGRTGIRIHAANLMGSTAAGFRSQLQGCLALGDKLGWLDGQKAILLSAPAIRRFEALMEYKPFRLVIEEKYGNS